MLHKALRTFNYYIPSSISQYFPRSFQYANTAEESIPLRGVTVELEEKKSNGQNTHSCVQSLMQQKRCSLNGISCYQLLAMVSVGGILVSSAILISLDIRNKFKMEVMVAPYLDNSCDNTENTFSSLPQVCIVVEDDTGPDEICDTLGDMGDIFYPIRYCEANDEDKLKFDRADLIAPPCLTLLKTACDQINTMWDREHPMIVALNIITLGSAVLGAGTTLYAMLRVVGEKKGEREGLLSGSRHNIHNQRSAVVATATIGDDNGKKLTETTRLLA